MKKLLKKYLLKLIVEDVIGKHKSLLKEFACIGLHNTQSDGTYGDGNHCDSTYGDGCDNNSNSDYNDDDDDDLHDDDDDRMKVDDDS